MCFVIVSSLLFGVSCIERMEVTIDSRYGALDGGLQEVTVDLELGTIFEEFLNKRGSRKLFGGLELLVPISLLKRERE